MPAPVTRPSLVLRLRDAGDTEAWETFDALYAPLIHNHCRRQGLQPSDAHDVTQETLTAVAAAIQSFDYDPAKGAFHSWLLTFTRHRLQRFYRQRDRLPTPLGSHIDAAAEHADTGTPLDPEWENDFRRLTFEAACHVVRPDVNHATWTAFWKTAVEGHKPDAVATELGTSTGAVYIAKSRVLARLRSTVATLTDQPVSQLLERLAS